MDWEAQKERLLAELDDGYDDSDAQDSMAKLTIEKAIQQTGQVVAEKDLEIERLQVLLDQQASADESKMAVGVQGIANMLDNDELIKEERENLRLLQEEWREKLRTAEVELAVERAKNARERTEVDEKIRDLEFKANALERIRGNVHQQDTKSSRSRRWLAQLGLISPDDTD
jgi:hypothetical protein